MRKGSRLMVATRFTLALILGGLAVAAACSDDDGSSDSENTTRRSDAGDAGRQPPPRDRDAGISTADSAMPDSAMPVSMLPALCSGCEDEQRDASDNAVHFHHVHVNTQ